MQECLLGCMLMLIYVLYNEISAGMQTVRDCFQTKNYKEPDTSIMNDYSNKNL